MDKSTALNEKCKCGNNYDRFYPKWNVRECLYCKRIRTKKYYYKNRIKVLARQKEYRKENPEKLRVKGQRAYASTEGKASALLREAVRWGKIKKPKQCNLCLKKSKVIEGHHPNYKWPYRVLWVCKKCHAEIHSKIRKEANDSER